ncbi:hypothetical protein EBL_c16870 [Shimwellia blattae DSM 4481 = NBRC 105725]|uniref:Uncharacterized protein n=1 Tax=Shimwellia blattae (strain ATCC 29907 / DSM 4481 / JCM 1650 / NBRC 105725 / CDC 9005-74) TaxID=630626 RepID=I2B8C7_SHIBC|nr:hypothetical protein EBL_c16870 [Shimwellia blattae DSM 4481 = NBRC 105725]
MAAEKHARFFSVFNKRDQPHNEDNGERDGQNEEDKVRHITTFASEGLTAVIAKRQAGVGKIIYLKFRIILNRRAIDFFLIKTNNSLSCRACFFIHPG